MAMNRLAVTARKIITPDTVILDGVVLVEGSKILDVGSRHKIRFTETEFPVVDGPHHFLVPGFIDVHVHGALGRDVMEGTSDALDVISQAMVRHGTTAYFATTVTASLLKTLQVVEALGRQVDQPRRGARMMGLHLEGPFINLEKPGIHPVEHIHPPCLPIFDELLVHSGNHIKLITMAPEVEGGLELVQHARSKGVVVSIGHSNATLEETREAIKLGATNVTHVFNAMRAFSHRDPGILGAVLTNSDVWVELIADGVHVSPVAINLLIKCKQSNRILLITDGVSATGMPDGQYRLGDCRVMLSGGVCRSPEGKLAGSTLTQDQALRNLLYWSGLPLEEIVCMVTKNPAEATGLADRKGSLGPGQDADMVLLKMDLTVQTTIVQGEVSYSTG